MNLFDSRHLWPVLSIAIGKPLLSENTVLLLLTSAMLGNGLWSDEMDSLSSMPLSNLRLKRGFMEGGGALGIMPGSVLAPGIRGNGGKETA